MSRKQHAIYSGLSAEFMDLYSRAYHSPWLPQYLLAAWKKLAHFPGWWTAYHQVLSKLIVPSNCSLSPDDLRSAGSLVFVFEILQHTYSRFLCVESSETFAEPMRLCIYSHLLWSTREMNVRIPGSSAALFCLVSGTGIAEGIVLCSFPCEATPCD